MTVMTTHKIHILIWSLVFTSLLIIVAFFVTRHPTATFDSAVSSISRNPNRWVDRQVSLSTYVDNQPIFGPDITSADINDHAVHAYKLLCDRLGPPPVTYYAEIASMPTQETIWQFDAYFVRLYATSSLDSDGSAVGVFPGRYEDFRKHSSDSSCASRDGFTRVDFTSPIRFLQNR